MRRISVLGASRLIALAIPTPASAEPSQVALPAEERIVTQGEVVTLADVSGLDGSDINSLVAARSGTDGEVTVDHEALLKHLSVHGEYVLPVAASASAKWADASGPITIAAVNDAHIEYITMMGSAPPKTLRVCRTWTSTTCNTSGSTGWLNNGQKTNIKFGWPDTDGYHHPSNSCTTYASWGVISYTFTKAGWIKTSGLNGGTWRVNMYCA